MKTLFKSIFVLSLILSLQSVLLAQNKTGDRSKKNSGASPQKPQGNTAEESEPGSTAATKLDDNKSKDPLENVKFRNLGPAVGGGRVTSVVGIPGRVPTASRDRWSCAWKTSRRCCRQSRRC